MARDGEVGEGVAYALADLPAPLISIDAHGVFNANRPARDIVGRADGSVSDLFAPAEGATLASFLHSVRTDGEATATLQLAAPVDGDGASAASGAANTEDGLDFRPDLLTLIPLPRFVTLHGRASSAMADGPGTIIASVVDVTATVRAQEVLESVVVSAWIMDDQARVLWGPFGRDSDRVGQAGQGSLADRIHPEDLAFAAGAFIDAMAGPGVTASAVIRARDPEFEGRWAQSRIELTNLSDDPRIGGVLGHTTSAEEAVAVPSISRTSGSHLSVAEAAPIGIILTGPKGLPLYFNEASMRLLPGVGVVSADLERDWTRLARPADQAKLTAMVEETLRSSAQTSLLARFEPPAGLPTWVMVTISPRLVEDNQIIGLVTTLQDVTSEIEAKEELEAAQQRLIFLARHDPLTGLVNRAELAEALASRLSGVAGSVAVLFCDLDGFKSVNDDHGHAVGDDLLRLAAQRLREVVTLAAPDAVVARVGGDEFVVVIGGTASAPSGAGLDALIDEVADDLVTALAQPFVVGDGQAQISISIGIAVATPSDDADAIVKRADAAMYEAKANGRGRAVRAAP